MLNQLQKFTTNELERLRSRLKHKRSNASQRGIEFNLDMQDMKMLGFKLLGHGVCDYTGLPFSTRISAAGEEINPKYPSIERIDDTKGYVRGNVCVVMHRANQLKDSLVDKKTSIMIQNPVDLEIVQAMMLNMSKDHLETLKSKYIPQEEEQEMSVDTSADMENEIAKMDIEAHRHIQEIAQEETPAPVVEEPTKLPEDVAVALAYANYCKSFADVGMNVSVTYAQFKAKYIRNKCAMTGEKLASEPKSVLVMDMDIGFAKDNFIIVSKKMEKAMTTLMIETRMPLPQIAAMLNKVV